MQPAEVAVVKHPCYFLPWDEHARDKPLPLVKCCLQVTSLLTTTTKDAVNSISDVVDTTINGFKSVYEDLKKAFGGFTFTIDTGSSIPESGSRSSSRVPNLLVASASTATHQYGKTAAKVLPASTELAAANATTKLLLMMAAAGSEKDADQTLNLLTAGEQLTSRAPLTPQGGVALLSLAE